MRSEQTHTQRMQPLRQSVQKYAESGFCAKAAAGEFDPAPAKGDSEEGTRQRKNIGDDRETSGK